MPETRSQATRNTRSKTNNSRASPAPAKQARKPPKKRPRRMKTIESEDQLTPSTSASVQGLETTPNVIPDAPVIETVPQARSGHVSRTSTPQPVGSDRAPSDILPPLHPTRSNSPSSSPRVSSEAAAPKNLNSSTRSMSSTSPVDEEAKDGVNDVGNNDIAMDSHDGGAEGDPAAVTGVTDPTQNGEEEEFAAYNQNDREEIVLEVLRQYIVSEMSLTEVVDSLEDILGSSLPRKWHDAISAATPEDDNVVPTSGGVSAIPPVLLSKPNTTRTQIHTTSTNSTRHNRTCHTRSKASVDYAPSPTEEEETLQENSDSSEFDEDLRQDSASSEFEHEAFESEDETKKRTKAKDTGKERKKKSKGKKRVDLVEDCPVLVKRPRHKKEDNKGKGKAVKGRSIMETHTHVEHDNNNNNNGDNNNDHGGDNKNKDNSDNADDKNNNEGDNDNNNGSGPEGSDDDELSTGPLPAAMKAEIWKIRAAYEEQMEAVAKKFKRSLQAVYREAGEITVTSRDPNLFNLFEKWWVAESGNNGEIPRDANPGTFLGGKWVELCKEKLGDDWNNPESIEEEFGYLRTWHLDHYSNHPKMLKGPTKADVRAVAKIAKQATLNRGLWVYGYVVDPSGKHSMITGWGKEFEAMKIKYPNQLSLQLHDVRILLNGERIKAQISTTVNDRLRQLVIAASNVGRDRGRERVILPQILLHDITELDVSCPKKFPWKTFPDFAYKNQIRIENWSEDIPAPGAGLKDVSHAIRKNGGPSQLTEARIKELIWLKEAWARKEENLVPPERLSSKALQVVSWTDEEKALPNEEQADIALVKCVDGRTLLSVLNSPSWRIQSDGDDEEREEGTRSRKPAPKPQKTRRATSNARTSSNSRQPASKSRPTIANENKDSFRPSSRSSYRPPPPEDDVSAWMPFHASSDAEDNDNGVFRRHPEPTPFSSPIKTKANVHARSQLFLGADVQQRHLQSSDVEGGDLEGDDANTNAYSPASAQHDNIAGPSRLPKSPPGVQHDKSHQQIKRRTRDDEYDDERENKRQRNEVQGGPGRKEKQRDSSWVLAAREKLKHRLRKGERQ
ncbi:hypothetical protein K435DRAFT_875288 [Dendrothele bispora CBS 962.96]|uniref:Uncharacterized protein n=1 Tax=Dendrothele bispora (strain CBS 962.96) TaxID=1314807 RepID=A0A4S8KV09_DENBC|nr:hypothetical protein K435DRAFT_875288 [Dendrothele bispora CBS 962.96]